MRKTRWSLQVLKQRSLNVKYSVIAYWANWIFQCRNGYLTKKKEKILAQFGNGYLSPVFYLHFVGSIESKTNKISNKCAFHSGMICPILIGQTSNFRQDRVTDYEATIKFTKHRYVYSKTIGVIL